MFIYASFIHTIPVELDESAQIDGANRFTTFWRVIFPLLRPVTASVIIFLALGAFNDLLGPLLFLGASKDKAVLTTLLFANLGKYQSNYDQLFALIWLVMVPVIVFFVAMQRQFISGLTQGALK
jgi:raffinose/stachyose/melibiose transport system permease protein